MVGSMTALAQWKNHSAWEIVLSGAASGGNVMGINSVSGWRRVLERMQFARCDRERVWCGLCGVVTMAVGVGAVLAVGAGGAGGTGGGACVGFRLRRRLALVMVA